ncbi:MAG: hypothetical protein ACI9F9_000674 [Candidatus Paceibacteria bacterium]|jgi:hypothetical protein
MSAQIRILAFLLALPVLAGCRSQESDAHQFPCICGSPEAAINACLHLDCASGEGNDENPDCACGTLSIEN